MKIEITDINYHENNDFATVILNMDDEAVIALLKIGILKVFNDSVDKIESENTTQP